MKTLQIVTALAVLATPGFASEKFTGTYSGYFFKDNKAYTIDDILDSTRPAEYPTDELTNIVEPRDSEKKTDKPMFADHDYFY